MFHHKKHSIPAKKLTDSSEPVSLKQMSTIDLVILGIIISKPMNAYEITQYVNNRELHRLLKISTPSIYKCCKRLFTQEYLSGKTLKEGENPEKTVYSVTKKGRDYFYQLMQHFSKSIQPWYFDFNSFIWNLGNIDSSEALALLLLLQKEIKQWSYWISEHEKEASKEPFPVRMIVKQYRMVIYTLVEWIDIVVKTYRKEKL